MEVTTQIITTGLRNRAIIPRINNSKEILIIEIN